MVLIPISWLGEHVGLPDNLTAEQLAADLVRVGLEEEAIHSADITGPVVVGRVVDRTPEAQKNGKTVNWCHVDVGAHNDTDGDGKSVPRGIVCGAHNFDAGDWVVVSLPGAVLPGGFAIAARKTYGHVSDGMICSARELGLGSDHDGIIVLTRLGHSAESLIPGAGALGLLGLGTEVLEVNITPDRGYCFSMRGLAREYALSTGSNFVDPGLTTPADLAPLDGGFPVVISDESPINNVSGCDRFVAQIVRGVAANAASPSWMQQRLTQAGMRPLGLAIDVTNYVMLDLGQPLHAYDLGSLAAPIVVRRAEPGEHVVTLDGQDRALDTEDLLITDSPEGVLGSRVIGLAGVMGGKESETADATTDLLIEAAHFDPVSIARTARRHRLSSEAAKRFERGVDTNMQRVAVRAVADLLIRYGGGSVDTTGTDVGTPETPAAIGFDLGYPTRLVGVEYTPQQVRQTLTAIGCVVGAGESTVQVQVPSWRPDLRYPEDLVEEVARIRGYDQIPSVVPRAVPGTGLTRSQRIRRGVADALAAGGLVEVLSYPFVNAVAFDAMGLPEDDSRRRAVRLANPLVEAESLMRTNLLVTLLETAQRNVARGNQDVSVFELGLVTCPDTWADAPVLIGGSRPDAPTLSAVRDAVPNQPRHVAGVLTGRREQAGWWGPGRPGVVADAVGAAIQIGSVAGVALTAVAEHIAPWHPGRCAALRTPDGTVVGHAGELHPDVIAAFGLPVRSTAFEVDLDAVIAAVSAEPFIARQISVFPVAKEDLAFVVDTAVSVGEVTAVIQAAAGDLAEDVRLFDVYMGDQVPTGTRSLAFALRLRAADRTLSAEDIIAVRERVIGAVANHCGGQLRGRA